ncbi:hypothetical protein EJA05_12860 [Pseudomonas oryziphila]|uniref:Uncharacterized protein n=1 Tax=Pseudomonas entomophila TaxID=312306 RepID=A0A3Q8U0H0_9PSED|nr:hypothetical protein EJA05_12860 [Pseudomonas oryziphila]
MEDHLAAAQDSTPWGSGGSPANTGIARAGHRGVIFAAKAAPTGTVQSWAMHGPCGSGFSREADDTVHGTGFAGVRG